MSSLNATSTLAEIKAAYADNASYFEDGSPAKARAFVTACRLLLLKLPKRVASGGRGQGEEVELDVRVIQDQIADAQRFLTQSGIAAGPPKVYSFENFRD
jgi:hypothetical protein